MGVTMAGIMRPKRFPIVGTFLYKHGFDTMHL